MLKKIEIFLRGIFLKLLLLLFRKPARNIIKVFNSESRILFIRLNKIGDALVSTPLLDAVKKYIGCRIYVLADKKNHFIFQNNPSVDEIKIFNKGISGVFEVRKFIKEKNIDTMVDLHDDVSTTVSFIIALSSVQNRLGLKKSNHKIYSDNVERLDSASHHIIDRMLELLKLFKMQVNQSEVTVNYFPNGESIQKAQQWFSNLNPENKFLLGINISAGSAARFWGVDRYKQLIASISDYNLVCVVFSTIEDYYLAKQIVEEKYIYPPSKAFTDIAAAILELNMLFTPDTSVIHIASINKIPVFGIYVKYNTRDMIWSPYNTKFDCVITEEPTLKNVTFEEVKEKFITFLEQTLNG
ncbi:MAG: glycosyltransferase family 9 protein [Ignavibacterium sp.]|nr:MAG: glycosyltransferase family 9 protein [Ignavibacterium sp.]